MYYWKNDLHTTLENGVKASSFESSFWRYMVNYTISFGVLGTLDPAVDLPALTSGTKSWPQPGADKNENIDDLWHAAVNSRGKYISASNTTEYSGALKSIIDDIAAITGVKQVSVFLRAPFLQPQPPVNTRRNFLPATGVAMSRLLI